MTTGVVTSVSPHNGSGTLTADVAIGATVLPLDDAEPFAEDFTEPRYLVIGSESTPREYVATVNDEAGQESVTLAVALDVAFEFGLPVTPWDPTVVAEDKRAVTHAVWVRLDGQDGTIRATVPHEFIPLTGVEALIGASVGLSEAPMSGWLVEQVYGREAVVDSGNIDVPVARGAAVTTQTIPAGTWTTVTSWAPVSTHPDIEVDGSSGYITLKKPGTYLCIATVRFVADASGVRQIRFAYNDPFTGVTPVTEVVAAPPPSGPSQPQIVAFCVEAEVGPELFVQVRQTSGGALDVVAADRFDTHLQVARVG